MKTVMTLLMAVGVMFSAFAQVTPLTQADSSARVDSLLHARIRVLPFPIVIDAVLRDFPHNLVHLTGELVLAQGDVENYASIVVLPDAENCTISRYHSKRDTTASWQAKMYTGDDFDKAAGQYRDLFKKLQGCYITLADGTVVGLQGRWEPAKESAAFTTSTFRVPTGDWRYREVKVELELVYLLADWAVHINIVSKRPDDEIGLATTGPLAEQTLIETIATINRAP
ncbi:hypothetical protein [Puia sp.]|jgi:hypothetical protein|uniref:hypothetical protein n=1 Tax=Puia sp. TaxID=2045100 RepID=UPI002F41FA48